jgi:hypothetical protein
LTQLNEADSSRVPSRWIILNVEFDFQSSLGTHERSTENVALDEVQISAAVIWDDESPVTSLPVNELEFAFHTALRTE